MAEKTSKKATGSARMSTRLKLKVGDASRTKKPRAEVTVRPGDQEQRQQTFVRAHGGALQALRIAGEIVHLDCKARNCRNSWTKEFRQDLRIHFEVSPGADPKTVKCLVCRRVYEGV